MKMIKISLVAMSLFFGLNVSAQENVSATKTEAKKETTKPEAKSLEATEKPAETLKANFKDVNSAKISTSKAAAAMSEENKETPKKEVSAETK